MKRLYATIGALLLAAPLSAVAPYPSVAAWLADVGGPTTGNRSAGEAKLVSGVFAPASLDGDDFAQTLPARYGFAPGQGAPRSGCYVSPHGEAAVYAHWLEVLQHRGILPADYRPHRWDESDLTYVTLDGVCAAVRVKIWGIELGILDPVPAPQPAPADDACCSATGQWGCGPIPDEVISYCADHQKRCQEIPRGTCEAACWYDSTGFGLTARRVSLIDSPACRGEVAPTPEPVPVPAPNPGECPAWALVFDSGGNPSLMAVAPVHCP